MKLKFKMELNMKNKLILLSLLVGTALSAQPATNSFFLNNPVVTIPEGNPVGVSRTFTVSGLSGVIDNIQIDLDITGGFNGDLYMYLVNPLGQFAVLLNRVGLGAANPFGYSEAGFNLTLDSSGSYGNVHNYGSPTLNGSGQVTGTFSADGRNINPQSLGSVFDSASTGAGLSLFNGVNGGDANGVWTLFAANIATGGGSPTLQNARLTARTTAVPEPSATALSLLGGGLLAVLAVKRKARRKKFRTSQPPMNR